MAILWKIVASFIMQLIHYLLVEIVLAIGDKSGGSRSNMRMLRLMRMLVRKVMTRMGMGRDVLSNARMAPSLHVVAAIRVAWHVASIHFLAVTLGEAGGSVGGQLPQILLLGQLLTLLVVSLALRVKAIPESRH